MIRNQSEGLRKDKVLFEITLQNSANVVHVDW